MLFRSLWACVRRSVNSGHVRYTRVYTGNILSLLSKEVEEAFRVVVPESHEPAAIAQCQRGADFQCNNAFRFAKVYGSEHGWRPMDIAHRIASNIPSSDLIASVHVAEPGFVNIQLNSTTLGSFVEDIATHGCVRDIQSSPRKVLVDFASPNMCKELHVGHLRSIVLGDAIARLLSYVGHSVSRVSHVGDWGTPIGMVLALCAQQNSTFRPDFLPSPEQLSDMYVKAKELFDSDEKFRIATYDSVCKLQQGDAELRILWSALCEATRRGFQTVFDRLGVVVDERGESTYASLIPPTLDELKEKQIVYESQGALVVAVPGFPSPMIVQKTDGSYLYATTDLATLKYRISEGYDQVVYVTDKTQTEHFRQIFAIGKTAGWYDPKRTMLNHITFGVVMGKDRKKLRYAIMQSIYM